MKKLNLNLVFITIVLLVNSCTFTSSYLNREDDNNDGKAFLHDFYNKIDSNNYAGIDAMVSDSLKQMTGPNGISKLVKYITLRAGKYKSYSIDDKYIRAVTGSINETSYNYKLSVTYDKGVIEEIIGMEKQNGSKIKLRSYHAYSDLLMH